MTKTKIILISTLVLILGALYYGFISLTGFWPEWTFPSSNVKNVGDLHEGRSYHTSTLLDDGRVLIYGGGGKRLGWALATAETYDPETHVIKQLSNFVYRRRHHKATKLKDGRVLMTGGRGNPSSDPVSAEAEKCAKQFEIFDPKTNISKPSIKFPHCLFGHSATLLPSGDVLIVRANYRGEHLREKQNKRYGDLDDLYLFDPTSETIHGIGKLKKLRSRYLAVVNEDRTKILLFGGRLYHIDDLIPNTKALEDFEKYGTLNGKKPYPYGCEVIYINDLSKNRTLTCPVYAGGISYSGVLLKDGRTLVQITDEAVIFDEELKTRSSVVTSSIKRNSEDDEQLVLLDSGRVAIIGGLKLHINQKNKHLRHWSNPTEVYNPETNTTIKDGEMDYYRQEGHTLTKLNDGSVLIVGGEEVSKRTSKDFFRIKTIERYYPTQ